MRAVMCRQFGGPESLRVEETASGPLESDQVRIRVHAAGINFADTLMIAGTYQVKPPFPFTPGMEAAGEIVEVGAAAKEFTVGQRVLATARGGGTYSDEMVAREVNVVPIPDAMPYDVAASFPVVYGTSHFALKDRGQLLAGETLLVLGAAGGVGLTAVEIGKQMGATVIAAAGGADKLAVCREHGADHVIDYRTESIRDRVKAITDDRGADVVYDPVGGDAFEQAFRAVNWQARLLIIGFAAGRIQQVPANHILVKNVSVMGVVWGAQAARDPAFVNRQLRELVDWWQQGKLKPVIGARFPLARAGDAMTALLSRKYPGKIVLTCD
ncbi:MAG: NADPH:quinone oxidoreductase family protein [Alphaproteobacteria bacterium]|nr:NADPH:quinone oxidoreductase family protein [Alphaproteobacteria bacterium]